MMIIYFSACIIVNSKLSCFKETVQRLWVCVALWCDTESSKDGLTVSNKNHCLILLFYSVLNSYYYSDTAVNKCYVLQYRPVMFGFPVCSRPSFLTGSVTFDLVWIQVSAEALKVQSADWPAANSDLHTVSTLILAFSWGRQITD